MCVMVSEGVGSEMELGVAVKGNERDSCGDGSVLDLAHINGNILVRTVS